MDDGARWQVTDLIGQIPALQRLICAYAPKKNQLGQGLVWAFDARMADIVRSTSEPMIGQMRLTWWHEVLSKSSEADVRGEPLLEALRRDVVPVAGTSGLLSAIEGWEILLEPLPLTDSQLIAFAEHRGGGLFRAVAGLAGGAPSWLAPAGMAWALWDLAGHVSDGGMAARALALAPEFLADVPEREWPPSIASLRMLTALVRDDVRAGRLPPQGLSAGQYVRILWRGLAGR